MRQGRCPNCWQTLDKVPKRKTKCPDCGKYIFVRSRQELFPSVLLTEQDATVVDHFQTLKGTATFEVSEADFFRERQELAERFGRQPKSGDVLWALYNRLVHDCAPSDESSLPFLYFLMAHFLYDDGREFRHVLRASNEMQLRQYQESPRVQKVQISTGGDASCEACQTLEGTVLTIGEALEQAPIPCKQCTFELSPGKPGWCRCGYVAAR
jgi:DNA-directed RNA polymerase subunit RPC12/RpoP